MAKQFIIPDQKYELICTLEDLKDILIMNPDVYPAKFLNDCHEVIIELVKVFQFPFSSPADLKDTSFHKLLNDVANFIDSLQTTNIKFPYDFYYTANNFVQSVIIAFDTI